MRRLFTSAAIVSVMALTLSPLSLAHVIGSTDLEDGAPHWYTKPYSLKYDAKWVNFENSSAEMNGADDIIVSGSGDFDGKQYGLRFATTEEWESFISGHTVKITLITRSSTGKPMMFKTAYMTNDNGFSGWVYGIANKEESSFSFNYKVPEITKNTKDFVVVVPKDQDTDLVIVDGYLEFVDE